MKLADLQEIAPNGGALTASCAAPATGGLQWMEIQEIPFTARELAEVVARFRFLRDKGPHLHWRATIFPSGSLAEFPSVTKDFPPLKGGVVVAVDERAYDPSLRPVWRACLTIHDTHHDVTFDLTAATLIRGIIDAVESGSSMIPAEPVEASIHDVADALLSLLLRAKAHGDSQHRAGRQEEEITVCGKTAAEIRAAAMLFIQSCEYHGIV